MKRGRLLGIISSFFLLLFSFLLSALAAVAQAPPASTATTGQAPQGATLVMTGDVPTPITLKASDLAAMTRQRIELPEPNGPSTVYEGVPLQAILEKAGIQFGRQLRGKALAGYVIAEAKDGYEVVFGLGELDPLLGGTRILVADTLNGGPLAADQGPLRLVLPGDKEGARSVRMLEKLEVVKLLK